MLSGRLLAALAVSAAVHAVVCCAPARVGGRSIPRSGGLPLQVDFVNVPGVSVRDGVPDTPGVISWRPGDFSVQGSSEPTPVLVASGEKGPQALPDADSAAFLPASALTRRPDLVEMPPLDSDETRLIVASGRVEIVLWIKPGGEVAQVDVVDSNVPEVLSEHVRKAFSAARFTPPEKDGQPVGARMRIEVNYEDLR